MRLAPPQRWAIKHLSWYAPRRPVFTGGNEVALLRGGDELFPAMCRAIDRARHEVWLACYIFNDDADAGRVVQRGAPGDLAARPGPLARMLAAAA